MSIALGNNGSLNITIGKTTIGTVSNVDAKHMRLYNGPDDPPPDWYLAWSSACYDIERIERQEFDLTPYYGRSGFSLIPTIGRVVYTFNKWEEIVYTTRNLPIRLLFQSEWKRQLALSVPMYRARIGPPVAHILNALPPFWNTYDE